MKTRSDIWGWVKGGLQNKEKRIFFKLLPLANRKFNSNVIGMYYRIIKKIKVLNTNINDILCNLRMGETGINHTP